jgi:hypothetical protein
MLSIYALLESRVPSSSFRWRQCGTGLLKVGLAPPNCVHRRVPITDDLII